MHCWKSINMNREYGTFKIILLSLMTMLLSFLTIFTAASVSLSRQEYRDDHAFLFLIALLLLGPLRKGLQVTLLSLLQGKVMPFSGKVTEPVGKYVYIFALMAPSVSISLIILICAFQFPSYAHYCAILISIHIGFCVPAFLRLYHLLHSPQKCYVEENEEGYEILITH